MTLQFYQQQMKILIEDFGPTEFTVHKTKMIWESCYDLPNENFAKIVKHFIKTKSNKYPPLPIHFEECAIEQRKTLNGEHRLLTHSNDEKTTIEQAGIALNEYLTKIGATSIMHAIEKQKALEL